MSATASAPVDLFDERLYRLTRSINSCGGRASKLLSRSPKTSATLIRKPEMIHQLMILFCLAEDNGNMHTEMTTCWMNCASVSSLFCFSDWS
jgi:hypothetical protein